VVRSRGRCSALRGDVIRGVWKKHLPATGRRLERVEVERNEVVEEEALDLPTENVDFGAEDVQSMPIAAGGTRPLRQCARPVLGC
jgi:hypothetical protein